jgi:hypothetical protein
MVSAHDHNMQRLEAIDGITTFVSRRAVGATTSSATTTTGSPGATTRTTAPCASS